MADEHETDFLRAANGDSSAPELFEATTRACFGWRIVLQRGGRRRGYHAGMFSAAQCGNRDSTPRGSLRQYLYGWCGTWSATGENGVKSPGEDAESIRRPPVRPSAAGVRASEEQAALRAAVLQREAIVLFNSKSCPWKKSQR